MEQSTALIYAPDKYCNTIVAEWINKYVKDLKDIKEEEINFILNKKIISRYNLFKCLKFFKDKTGRQINIPKSLSDKRYLIPISTIKQIIKNLSNGKEIPEILTTKNIFKSEKISTDILKSEWSIMDLFIHYFDKQFYGDKKDIDLLVLESSLPCKQQHFELTILGEHGLAGKAKGWLQQIKNKELDQDNLDILLETIAQNSLSFADLHENWDGMNLIYDRGIPIGFIEGKERSLTTCSDIMKFVKEALDNPANKGKDPKQIQIDTWKEIKEHLDEINSKIKSKDIDTGLDPESTFGLGRRHKTKKRKNKRKHTKRKTRKYIKWFFYF